MTFRLVTDPMLVVRAAAVSRVDAHFNAVAQRAAHTDILALARGDSPHPVEAREASRLAILQAVAGAASPADVNLILSQNGIPG